MSQPNPSGTPEAPSPELPLELWTAGFDQARIALAFFDPLGRLRFGNQRFSELLGYSTDDLGQLDLGSLGRTEDAAWTARVVSQLLSGVCDSFESDKWFIHKSGSEVSGKLTIWSTMHEGRCVGLFASIVPITPPVAENDAAVRKVLQNIDGIITVINADFTIRSSTGNFRTALGYPELYWSGRSILDIVAEDQQALVERMQVEVLANPAVPIDEEVVVKAADGSHHLVLVTAVNLLNDPDVEGVVITSRNVTHLRDAREDLIARRDEAVDKETAMRHLLATVSHELRNPLHSLQGTAELIERVPLSDETPSRARSLRLHLASLTNTVDDLLESAQLDTGEFVLHSGPVSIRELVSDACDLAQPAGVAQRLDVRARFGDTVPTWVLADKARLRQVLGNIVGNAVRYTDEGIVTVEVSAGGDDQLAFEITDDGCGVDARDLPFLFDPFFTGRNSSAGTGAGLGLSIVKRLVTLMHGTITVDSVVGEGTRVRILLPLPATEPATPTADTAPVRAGLRVLVVEDDPVNQQLAASQLRLLAASSTVVGSGEDALELLTSPDVEPFDVALMDLQLPGIDGLEVTKRWRASESARAIPDDRRLTIVGVTANASTADRVICLDAGMDGFIAKPASLDTISSAISRALSGRRLERPAGEWMNDPSFDLTGGHPNVDLGTLARLTDELGDAAVVVGLVTTFLGELESRTAAMIRAAEVRDGASMKRAAHTLKSSAHLLGCSGLGELCEALERGSFDVEALVENAEATENQLRSWLQEAATHARGGDR